MQNYISDLKQVKKIIDFISGEKEKITSKNRLKTGIPIDKELKTDFLF